MGGINAQVFASQYPHRICPPSGELRDVIERSENKRCSGISELRSESTRLSQFFFSFLPRFSRSFRSPVRYSNRDRFSTLFRSVRCCPLPHFPDVFDSPPRWPAEKPADFYPLAKGDEMGNTRSKSQGKDVEVTPGKSRKSPVKKAEPTKATIVSDIGGGKDRRRSSRSMRRGFTGIRTTARSWKRRSPRSNSPAKSGNQVESNRSTSWTKTWK